MSNFSVAVVKTGVNQFDIYGINDKSKVAMLLESITTKTHEQAVGIAKTTFPALTDDLFIPIEEAGLSWDLGAYEALSGKIIALKVQEEEKRAALMAEMNERYGPIWSAFMKQAEREGWVQSHALYTFLAEDHTGNIYAYSERPTFVRDSMTWGPSPMGKIRGIRLSYYDGSAEQPSEVLTAVKTIGWEENGGSVSYENRIVERTIDPSDVYMTFGKYKGKRVGDMPISYTSYICNKVTDPQVHQMACVEACKKVVECHNNKKGGA